MYTVDCERFASAGFALNLRFCGRVVSDLYAHVSAHLVHILLSYEMKSCISSQVISKELKCPIFDVKVLIYSDEVTKIDLQVVASERPFFFELGLLSEGVVPHVRHYLCYTTSLASIPPDQYPLFTVRFAAGGPEVHLLFCLRGGTKIFAEPLMGKAVAFKEVQLCTRGREAPLPPP